MPDETHEPFRQPEQPKKPVSLPPVVITTPPASSTYGREHQGLGATERQASEPKLASSSGPIGPSRQGWLDHVIATSVALMGFAAGLTLVIAGAVGSIPAMATVLGLIPMIAFGAAAIAINSEKFTIAEFASLVSAIVTPLSKLITGK